MSWIHVLFPSPHMQSRPSGHPYDISIRMECQWYDRVIISRQGHACILFDVPHSNFISQTSWCKKVRIFGVKFNCPWCSWMAAENSVGLTIIIPKNFDSVVSVCSRHKKSWKTIILVPGVKIRRSVISIYKSCSETKVVGVLTYHLSWLLLLSYWARYLVEDSRNIAADQGICPPTIFRFDNNRYFL